MEITLGRWAWVAAYIFMIPSSLNSGREYKGHKVGEFAYLGQELADELPFKGMVVDLEGKPLGEVSVELRRGLWGPMWATLSDNTEGTFVSVIDGSFEVSRPVRGSWRLLFTKQGYSPFALNLQKSSREQLITMRPAAEVSGLVLDSEGKAIMNAAVFARLVDDEGTTPRHVAGWDKTAWPGKVSTTGEFNIAGLPMGLPIRIWANKDHEVPQPAKSLVLSTKEVEDVVVVVVEGVRIQGTVSENLLPEDRVVWIKEATMHKFPFASPNVPIVDYVHLDAANQYSFQGVSDGDWVIGYGRTMGEYATCRSGGCSLASVAAGGDDRRAVQLDFKVP